MQVIQIGDDWPTERPGGLNSYFSNLIRQQSLLGVDAHGVVVGTDEVRVDSGGTVLPFAQSSDPLLHRLRYARRAVQDLFQKFTIDLISVHFALYALPIPDRVRTTPTVVHFHGPWAAESGVESSNSVPIWVKAQLEKSVYSAARSLIVLSQAFKEELIRGYGVAEDRIQIVPGGVDTEKYNTNISRAEARALLGWPNDRKILVTIRRQVRRMGLENLIDAAHVISLRDRSFVLYLGGTGPISGELQRRIEERGLTQNVKMLGRVSDEDLALVYRAADMSVVPTQALEGFGLIAIESLAAGTPVYVTPVGGLPEIVRPFAPQCIFTDSSVESIADCLSGALREEHAIPSEAACRAYAVDNFAWPKIARRVLSVYEKALA
jgi:glycogen(starch) synthase